jgi:hypothetical protein
VIRPKIQSAVTLDPITKVEQTSLRLTSESFDTSAPAEDVLRRKAYLGHLVPSACVVGIGKEHLPLRRDIAKHVAQKFRLVIEEV